MFTTIISHPNLGTAIDTSLAGSAGDAVKLLMFPFVALLMEIKFIIQARRGTKKPATTEETPISPPIEEPMESEEEPIKEEPTSEVMDPTPTYDEPVEEEFSEEDDEIISDEEESSEFE